MLRLPPPELRGPELYPDDPGYLETRRALAKAERGLCEVRAGLRSHYGVVDQFVTEGFEYGWIGFDS